jgi:hypothetical protein
MRIMILERKDVMLYKARKGAYDEALAAGLENEAALQCQTRTLALGAEEMVPPWMTVAAAWSAREEKVKAKKEKAEKAKEKAKADKAKAKKDNKDKRHSKAESDGKPDTDMAEKEAEAETDPEAEFDTATDPGVDLQDRLANFHVPIREPPIELSAWHTLVTLASMPRGLVAFLLVFVFGFLVGAIDSTLAMRVSAIWNKDAKYVGIMYVIAAAPSFFGGPLAGHIADQVGAEWIVAPTLIYALPWVPLMTWHKDIAPFIVFYALGLLAIMILNSISSLEMAIVAKFKPGISEIHMFATMNLVFAVSSAVGAIVGGQIYGHVRNGWDVICWIGFTIFVVSIPPTLVYTGRRPLLSRILRIPEPRACLPPGEREAYDHTRRGGAAEDPEAAAANTQTGDNVTSNKSSN